MKSKQTLLIIPMTPSAHAFYMALFEKFPRKIVDGFLKEVILPGEKITVIRAGPGFQERIQGYYHDKILVGAGLALSDEVKLELHIRVTPRKGDVIYA